MSTDYQTAINEMIELDLTITEFKVLNLVRAILAHSADTSARIYGRNRISAANKLVAKNLLTKISDNEFSARGIK
jgi:hypothetical protein